MELLLGKRGGQDFFFPMAWVYIFAYVACAMLPAYFIYLFIGFNFFN